MKTIEIKLYQARSGSLVNYNNNTPINFTDLAATNYPYRFYRAIYGP